jgi:hypothetical protein
VTILLLLGAAIFLFSQFDRLGPAPGARRNAGRHSVALVRVGPVRIAISALAPFRPPGWGSVGCRTFVELNLSGALDARHHLGDPGTISGVVCQVCGTVRKSRDYDLKLHAPLRTLIDSINLNCGELRINNE